MVDLRIATSPRVLIMTSVLPRLPNSPPEIGGTKSRLSDKWIVDSLRHSVRTPALRSVRQCGDRISGVLAAARLRSGSTVITVRGMRRNIKSCTRPWQISMLFLVDCLSDSLLCPLRTHTQRSAYVLRCCNLSREQSDLQVFGFRSGPHDRSPTAYAAKLFEHGPENGLA